MSIQNMINTLLLPHVSNRLELYFLKKVKQKFLHQEHQIQLRAGNAESKQGD